jgi:glutamyl/glutaminyl-tRNA synthetase
MLPEALINYLALLGWSPGGDKELMSREEMTALFSLDRVQSSPAQMDMQKLEWMNGEYMRRLPKDELQAACIQALKDAGLWTTDSSEAYLENVLTILGERIKFFSDIATQAGYFFTDEYEYDDKAVRKRLLKEGSLDYLAEARTLYSNIEAFTHENLETALREHAEQHDVGMGKYVHPIRVAVSGTQAGPGLFEMLEVLGKDVVLKRIDKTLERFKAQGESDENA